MNGFMSSASSPERQRLEKFHEDYIFHKSAKGKSWNKVWVVIRGHFMFAFKSRQTHKPDQLIGYLLLNYHTVCKNRGDDKPGRFKFDVHTIDKDGRMMHNRFRCESRPERDLWRGYILGLATGRIPEDVPLTPSQLHAIASAMDRLQSDQTKRPSPGSVPPPLQGNGSNEFLGMDNHLHANGTMMLSNGVHSVSAGSSASSSGGSGGRPSIPQIMEHKHKFHEDPELNLDDHPCWFFETCNREKAEQLLECGQTYGSVLMRESTTFRDSGSYTISMRNFPGSATRFSHFQVMRVARGYKIQFDYEHEPLTCLSDIMAYFVSVSGTQPLRTNDMDLLLSGTAKPGNISKGGMHPSAGHAPPTNGTMNRFNNGGTLSHINGNCFNNGGNGLNLSRKDSAMDIVNDAFQFLDNKSCVSVNSNGNVRGCCDCDGTEDACHYSVAGDDENGRDDGELDDGRHFGHVNGHSTINRQNGYNNHSSNGHHDDFVQQHNTLNSTKQHIKSGYNGVSSSRLQHSEERRNGGMNNNNDESSGPFFQSELSARLSRRKESVEVDDNGTFGPSSSFSSNGGGTANIPLLSATLQSRVPPPPPPLPPSAVFGCEGTDEVYVNSDDVIAQTNNRNHHAVQQQQTNAATYARPQAPRLPPRPAALTYESCSAELIEKLQRRLSRIPDA